MGLNHRLDLDLLFKVPSVANYDISLDGTTLAYSWNGSGHHEIYSLVAEEDKGRQITESSETKLSPRFSPDGKSLIYAQDHQGDEFFDLFRLDLDRSEITNLTPDTPESIYPHVRWSPDGKQIAYNSNRSGKFSIYTQRIDDTVPHLLSEHKYVDYHPEWSPDGGWVAFTSLVTSQDKGVFLVSRNGGEARRLNDRGKPLEASEPSWSPDGGSIAFRSAERGTYDIGVYSLRDEAVTWLTDGKRECYGPVWDPEGRHVAYGMNLGSDIAIAVGKMDGSFERLEVGPGIHHDLRFAPDGKSVLFLHNGPKNPDDLWSYSFVSEEFSQITRSLPSNLDCSGFVTPTAVSYSSTDGRRIPALLYRPTRVKAKASAVIYIHGGPTAQFTNSWNPVVQEFLDHGWIVLAPNYRGSTGHGKEFREANRFVMGKLDLDDVAMGARFLVGSGICDENKIAVTGGSFGGYLTMCALTKYPDLWAAGSAIVPFLNWFTEIANERDDLQYWDKQNMGDPERDKERLHDASPIFILKKVKAPVQMIAGAHDPRCPASETIQARDELQRLGKTVETIIYQDEGHGFRKLDNRLDAYRKSVSFLNKYLS